MSHLNFSYLNSEFGEIYIVARTYGASKVIFGRDRFKEFQNGMEGTRIIEGGGIAEELCQEIGLYLEGRLSKFKTKLQIVQGTPFQRAVWKKLIGIPYGCLITYKGMARQLGRPNAARAVGNAIGANPLPIVVPCHRVLGSKGIGGYSCGIHVKERLLRLEGSIA